MQRLPDSILKEIGDVSCKLFNSLRTMEIQMGAGIVLLRYESPSLFWFVIAFDASWSSHCSRSSTQRFCCSKPHHEHEILVQAHASEHKE